MSEAYKPLRGIFIIILAVAAVVLVSKIFRPREIIPWRLDFTAARQEAQASHKLILAYFTADWCAPCQVLRHTTWADEKVERALRDYIPTKIDVDQNRDLAIRYNADPIPYLAVLGDDGLVLKQFSGPAEADEFLAWLHGKGNAGVAPTAPAP